MAATDPDAARRTGREMPHDLQAEQAVVGALLIDDTAFDRVADRLRPEDFYLEAHQLVFRACAELAGDRHTIDPILSASRAPSSRTPTRSRACTGPPARGEGAQPARRDIQDVELHVAKQRQGATGKVDLVFFAERSRFAGKHPGS